MWVGGWFRRNFLGSSLMEMSCGCVKFVGKGIGVRRNVYLCILGMFISSDLITFGIFAVDFCNKIHDSWYTSEITGRFLKIGEC